MIFFIKEWPDRTATLMADTDAAAHCERAMGLPSCRRKRPSVIMGV